MLRAFARHTAARHSGDTGRGVFEPKGINFQLKRLVKRAKSSEIITFSRPAKQSEAGWEKQPSESGF
jgi:hypothetical protein